MTNPLAEMKSIDHYFRRYGGVLADKAQKALRPLHDPKVGPLWPGIDVLKGSTRLYEPQAHVVTGLCKLWERQSGVMLIGEPGSGKTKMGAVLCHAHAQRLRNGWRRRGRPYRVLVMCPDHLIGKWAREIQETIPNAYVRTFDGWKDVLAFSQTVEEVTKDGGKPPAPKCPEYYILGRDQSKFDPDWRPTHIERWIFVKEGGKKKAIVRAACCPKCGAPVTDAFGTLKSRKSLGNRMIKCKANVPWYDPKEDDPSARWKARECGEWMWSFYSKPSGTSWAHRWADPWLQKKADERREAKSDGSLDQAYRRWPPARALADRLPWKFDYMIADEVHELLTGDSDQSTAFGKLAGKATRVAVMTGTLINGYPNIFAMMFRVCPNSLRKMGYGWDDAAQFQKDYGRMAWVTTTKWEDEKKKGKGMGKTSSRTVSYPRPGVMPSLFGDHLIGSAAFLGLHQMSDELPPYEEFPVALDMDDELAEGYATMEESLREAIAEMLARGDKAALGSFLQVMLGYPDHPYGWGEIGYWRHFEDPPGVKHRQWCHLYDSVDLAESTIRTKDAKLLELIAQEHEQNRQVWVYCEMTNVRNVVPRLRDLIRDELGLSCEILTSGTVPRREREEWIAENGPYADVIISHPKLVETGMDLFDKGGRHNFCSLIFYETGYNLYTLRQASCRAWRLMQPRECRTWFLYYRGTMQDNAMRVMGQKLAAAQMLEGVYDPEGLAAMAGTDDATLALARSLIEAIPETAEDLWKKVGFNLPTSGATGRVEATMRRVEEVRDDRTNDQLVADFLAEMFGRRDG